MAELPPGVTEIDTPESATGPLALPPGVTDVSAPPMASRRDLPGMEGKPWWAAPPGLGMKLGMVVPGAGLLGQAIGQGLTQGGASLAEGNGPLGAAASAGGGAAGAGVLGGAQRLGAKALSSFGLPAYTAQIGNSIATKLKGLVPALDDTFPATIAGLKKMLYSQSGTDAVHSAYDASLKSVIAKGTGTKVTVPRDTAEVFGIPVPPSPGDNLSPSVREALAAAGRLPPEALQTGVPVDAGLLAQGMTGRWKGNAGAYQAAARALDDAGIGDPAARAAYKTYIGIRSYFDKTPGSLPASGGMDLMKAQAGLTKGRNVDELLRRHLGEFADLLMPGGRGISKGNLAGPLAVGGGLAGAFGGLGVPGLSHGTGALPGAWLGHKVGQYIPTYTGIPQGRVGNFLQQLMPRAGGIAGGALAAPPQEPTP